MQTDRSAADRDPRGYGVDVLSKITRLVHLVQDRTGGQGEGAGAADAFDQALLAEQVQDVADHPAADPERLDQGVFTRYHIAGSATQQFHPEQIGDPLHRLAAFMAARSTCGVGRHLITAEVEERTGSLDAVVACKAILVLADYGMK